MNARHNSAAEVKKQSGGVLSSVIADGEGQGQQSQGEDERKGKENDQGFDYLGVLLLAIVIFITIFLYPRWDSATAVTIHHVFYYGWITAISTGLGVLPCCIFSNPSKFWIGVSNGNSMFSSLYLFLPPLFLCSIPFDFKV